MACVAVLALAAWRELSSRSGDLRNAEVEMENLARSLTQHAEDSFALADTILVGLVDRLEADGASPSATAKIQQFLRLREVSDKRIRGVFVYDEAGRWLATTEQVDLSRFNNSDREYFRHHRTNPDRGPLIGPPVKSRSGGQWIITTSRRFNYPDGRFAGVALVTIDVSYFSSFYDQFDIGPNGSISLLSTDGILLARAPVEGSFIGRDLSDAPLFRTIIPQSKFGAYSFTSPIDGRERLSFYKLSDRFPLIVLATKARQDVLTP